MRVADLVPATLEHARELAASLRAEDREELRACGEPDPYVVIARGVTACDVSFAAVLDGHVGAMFGVGPLDPSITEFGQIWFLTGDLFAKRPRAFVAVARKAMGLLLEKYPEVGNVIDARYAAAVRWAKWLGFEVGAPLAFGPEKRLFHPARFKRS